MPKPLIHHGLGGPGSEAPRVRREPRGRSETEGAADGRGDHVPVYFRASAENTGIQAHRPRGRDHLSDPSQLKAGCG